MSSSWKTKLVEVGEAALAALAKADASTTRRAFARIVRSPSWRAFRLAFMKAFPTKADLDASAAAVAKELAKTFLGADQLAAYSLKGQHMPKADAQAHDVCAKARTKAVRRVKYIMLLVRAFYSHAAGPLVDDYAAKYKLWHDDVAKLAHVKAAPKTDSWHTLVKMARKNEKLAKEGRDEAFEKLVAEYGSSKAAAVRGGLRDAEYSDVSSRISECSLSDDEEEEEDEEDGEDAAAAAAKVAAAVAAASEAKEQLKEQKAAAAAALKAAKDAAAAAKKASNEAAAAAAKKLEDIAAATNAVDIAHAESVVAYDTWQKSPQTTKFKTAWQTKAKKVTDAIAALKALQT